MNFFFHFGIISIIFANGVCVLVNICNCKLQIVKLINRSVFSSSGNKFELWTVQVWILDSDNQ